MNIWRTYGGCDGLSRYNTSLSCQTVKLAPGYYCCCATLVCLENTHNRGGGSVYTVEDIRSIAKLTSAHNIGIHLDGARLFNAALANGTTVAEFTSQVDSVSICFSKGLGTPAGSLLCGSADFIDEARRYRKMLGGGMRQVGILAAACLDAMENHVDRLVEDHDNARKLAFELAQMSGIRIDPHTVVSNIVLFDVSETGVRAEALVERLDKEGVLTIPFGPTTIRAVTHMDVNGTDIEKALETIGRLLNGV